MKRNVLLFAMVFVSSSLSFAGAGSQGISLDGIKVVGAVGAPSTMGGSLEFILGYDAPSISLDSAVQLSNPEIDSQPVVITFNRNNQTFVVKGSYTATGTYEIGQATDDGGEPININVLALKMSPGSAYKNMEFECFEDGDIFLPDGDGKLRFAYGNHSIEAEVRVSTK